MSRGDSGTAKRPDGPARMAEHAYRFADALHERGDVLELAFTRVVGVITAQTTTSRAHQVAREVLDQEREHEEPRDLAIAQPAVNEDDRCPLSLNPSRDLRAVVRNRHMDLMLVHVASLGLVEQRSVVRSEDPLADGA